MKTVRVTVSELWQVPDDATIEYSEATGVCTHINLPGGLQLKPWISRELHDIEKDSYNDIDDEQAEPHQVFFDDDIERGIEEVGAD